MVMTLIDFLVPDEPTSVTTQRERMDFINTKIIDKVADEEEDASVDPRECSLLIKDNDDGPYFHSIKDSFLV